MKINIKPIHNTSHDCIQSCTATLANYYNMDYQMFNLGRWNFEYNNIIHYNTYIGNRIKPYSFRKVCGHELFHGIYWEAINGYSDSMIKCELLDKGIPTMVSSDLFYCPWNTAYQKYNYQHYFILIGYEKDKFICLDPYMNDLEIEYQSNELYAGMKCFYILKRRDVSVNKYMFIKELQNDIMFFRNNGITEKILMFADDIENKLDIREEKEGIITDLYAIPLIDNIRIISLNRKGYSEMINYLSTNVDLAFYDCISLAYECAKKWDQIRLYLIKYFINYKDIRNELSKMIREVSLSENYLFEVLSDKLKKLEKESI